MSGENIDSTNAFADHFAELRRGRDFPFSLSAATPWKVGIVICFGLLAVFLPFDFFANRTGPDSVIIFGGNVETYVLALLTTYVLVANEHGRASFASDMVLLSPVLKATPTEQVEVFSEQVTRRGKRRVLAGLVVNLIAFPFLMPVYLRDEYSIWASTSLALQVALLIFVVGNAFYDAIDMNIRMRRLTAKGFNIDLLDLSSLDSFGRMGLATAAKIFVGSAVALPLMLDEGATMVTASFVLLMMLLAVFVLVLPSRSARNAIIEEKQRVLSDTNDKIRVESQQNTGEYDMAGLIAYRNFIADIREWPLGTPVLIRFVAIGVVPVLSWFAAAFADQIVEKFVG